MNNSIEIIENTLIGEITYKTKLANGLDVYICKRPGFNKKMALFGTKYGSITNDFIDITTGERTKVPDGIAHFLEHKLFEQEGANALDLFSKEGISSNAYTSFDQTVYYFETVDKFEKGLEMLIQLVKTPYFTEENVDKEQGIIGQEISMYDNDPSFKVYFNILRAMYVEHPVRIDIAGTKETISHITKDILYTCYNTFYNPNNMFMVIVADIDVNDTLKFIEKELKKYESKNEIKEIVKYPVNEPENICQKEIVEKMGVSIPEICIGYKLKLADKNDIIKNAIISEFINEMYFSETSEFFEKEYNEKKVAASISFGYESSKEFSHVIISTVSNNIEELKKDVKGYIEIIKKQDIDDTLFNMVKKQKIGENIIESESISRSYRRIIDAIVSDADIYYDIDFLNNITKEDIKEFLNQLDYDKCVYSIIN